MKQRLAATQPRLIGGESPCAGSDSPAGATSQPLVAKGKECERLPKGCCALQPWEELPQFLQHNQFIRTGYRVNYNSGMCVRSLFQLHNETCNIWTHLLGAVFFLLVAAPALHSMPTRDTWDIAMMCLYLGAATVQMANSTIFHIFNCLSPTAYRWTARLDYSGVNLMIVGSYVPILYWGFTCYPFWRHVYIYSICSLGIIGLCICWFPVFTTPRFRVIRTSFFVVMGWVSLVPVIHLIFLEGIALVWSAGKFELLMGIIYTVAAFFYASRIPERWYPGAFDYSCSSHVIWHVLIFVAAIVQMLALLYAHRIAVAHICPAALSAV